MRFYEIDGGRITVDGVDTREMTRDDLRTTFGMVLQDTWLFHGTIRENIAYGKEDATEEEIVAAAEAAHVDHFVRTLPDGYDTVIDDDATNVSAGEKQLLTIARAFLADPPILILDEATSSVDTRTEVLIQRAMARLMKGRTTFVIAHRLSTIRDADTILVMNHGHIVEQGTHEAAARRRAASTTTCTTASSSRPSPADLTAWTGLGRAGCALFSAHQTANSHSPSRSWCGGTARARLIPGEAGSPSRCGRHSSGFSVPAMLWKKLVEPGLGFADPRPQLSVNVDATWPDRPRSGQVPARMFRTNASIDIPEKDRPTPGPGPGRRGWTLGLPWWR